MLSGYITSLADVSFHIVASMYVRFRYSGKNPMRFAVFWRISVRFCGFRTLLTPPSFIYDLDLAYAHNATLGDTMESLLIFIFEAYYFLSVCFGDYICIPYNMSNYSRILIACS